ncbi:olfactory receptor 13H1-like [Cynocephalus volans]|uniref:olfactory receptor 13H1-like n=1 Tax=Cynocephalus volans TaxID=110931 RepID=UPI002FCBF1FA
METGHLQRCYLQPRAAKRVLERKGAEPARAAAHPVPARLSCREARPLCHPFPDPSPDALAYELHGDEKRLPSAPSTVAGAVSRTHEGSWLICASSAASSVRASKITVSPCLKPPVLTEPKPGLSPLPSPPPLVIGAADTKFRKQKLFCWNGESSHGDCGALSAVTARGPPLSKLSRFSASGSSWIPVRSQLETMDSDRIGGNTEPSSGNIMVLGLDVGLSPKFGGCRAGVDLWIDEMNYQEIGNHTKVTEFVLVGLSNHPTSQSVLFWALMFHYILTLAGNSMIVFLVGVSSQLHTPMYFFLGNSSLLDLLFSTSALPLIMAHSLQNSPTISYSSCFAQLAIRAFLALAECFLLAIMAYDRFVAISNPLRYNVVMSSRVCTLMALVVWVTAFLLTVVPILLFPISFCGHNAVNHFSCEVQAIFKLLCSNTISLEVMMMVCAVISMPVPLTFILISYLCILRAVLRIHPTEARLKAFSTCGSHLVVVTIYFGTLIYISMRPQAKKSQDGEKIVSIFYAAVTPMLNPLIYTLRNKDVKAALRRVSCGAKSSCFKHTTVCWVIGQHK